MCSFGEKKLHLYLFSFSVNCQSICKRTVPEVKKKWAELKMATKRMRKAEACRRCKQGGRGGFLKP